MRKPSSPNNQPSTTPRSKSFRANYQPTTNNSPKPSRKSRKGLAFLIFLLEFALLGTILYFHFGRGEEKTALPIPETTEAPAPTPAPIDYSADAASLRITEVMAKNTAFLMQDNNVFPDWVELTSSASQPIDLTGWSLSDGKGRWTFPAATTIAPGQHLLITCEGSSGLTTGFSLSEGETLTLADPNGTPVDTCLLTPVLSNVSLVRNAYETLSSCAYPTPGYDNTPEGYSAFCASLPAPAGPLAISEICSSNNDYNRQIAGEYADWVELTNISASPVNLSGYYLSDKKDSKLLFPLPEKDLAPGEMVLIYCSKDYTPETLAANPYVYEIMAPFSLGSDGDELFLTAADGTVVDFAAYTNMPINGSFGRMDGQRGWFYFAASTPLQPNTGGERRVSSSPVSSLATGQYNGVSSLTVELSAPAGGKVYYTTGDESRFDALTEYSGPITISATTILRAVTVEQGAVPSRVSTWSYFVNENHTFPIVSLVADSFSEFYGFDNSGNKFIECPGTVSLIENNTELFSRTCAIRLKGFTAVLDKFKKNYGVYFKDRLGSSDLTGMDLFNNGVTDYSSLLIRAGQDWSYDGACIRNEVMETLCHQFTPVSLVPVQSNKYVVLYLDGKYHGIYSLKQDNNRQLIASLYGVSKQSVSTSSGNPEYGDPIWDVLEFCRTNNMADPALYEQFSAMFNLDNLIDYLVLQSYGGNIDLYNNVKYFMSTELDSRWGLIFYDQDQTFYRPEGAVNIIFGGYAKPSPFLTDISKSLCKNPDFRDRFLRRYAEALSTTLSDENVLSVIDDLCNQLSPEMERDRARISTTVAEWQIYVDDLRNFFRNGYRTAVIDNLTACLGLTDAERASYFG